MKYLNKLAPRTPWLPSALAVIVGFGGLVAGARADYGSVGEIINGPVCTIINYMFTVLIFATIVMVLFAAYMYLTAAGDAEQVKKATKTITYAAVAMAVALLAKGFPLIVANIFPSGATISGSACPF